MLRGESRAENARVLVLQFSQGTVACRFTSVLSFSDAVQPDEIT